MTVRSVACGKIEPFDCRKLETRLQTVFAEAECIGELHVGVTEAETGAHQFLACINFDARETAAAIAASCAMPTITRGARKLAGNVVLDGDISDQLPIAKIIAKRPEALVVIMPTQWPWWSLAATPARNLVLLGLSGQSASWPLRIQLLFCSYQTMWTLRWLHRQLRLPLGDAKRVLPPTLVALPRFAERVVNPLHAEQVSMRKAAKTSYKAWLQAFQNATHL